jgi:hypothetical protein
MATRVITAHTPGKRLYFSIFPRQLSPCGPLKVNRRFGGTIRLHLQGTRISQTINQCESRCQAADQNAYTQNNTAEREHANVPSQIRTNPHGH